MQLYQASYLFPVVLQSTELAEAANVRSFFYKKDFGDGSPAATINFIAGLMGRKGDLFRRFIRTPGSLTVKYNAFSFNARTDHLTALWPPEAEETECIF